MGSSVTLNLNISHSNPHVKKTTINIADKRYNIFSILGFFKADLSWKNSHADRPKNI
jgi:hypothetical protein